MGVPAPVLVETKRLLTRALTREDVDPWMEFMLGAGSLDYMPFAAPTREGSEWWIRRQLDRYDRDGHGLVALLLKADGSLAGQSGLLTQEVDGSLELEVGYHIMPRLRGRGLASEAARAFKELALTTGTADTVVSIIHVDNTASQRVAVRNGMIRERRIEMYGAPHWLYRTVPG